MSIALQSSDTLVPERATGSPAVPSPAIAALRELAKGYNLANTEALIAQGKVKAVWGGSTWEAPLVFASGYIPVGFGELWRDSSKEAEAVGENVFHVPPEFCSMIKSIIGRLHLRRESLIKKILFFGGYCEPAIVFELAKKDGYELFTIEGLTAFREEEKRPELIAFLVKELERTALWLTGKPVDQDRLREEIRLKNRVLGKIRRILKLRLDHPFRYTALPTMQVLAGSGHYFGKPARYLEILDQVIAELEAPGDDETRPYIPLILAGGAAGGPGLINAIEESGGVIVAWIMTSTTDYREDVPPLESLAHYLFDSQRKGELGEGAGTSCTNRRIKVEELVRQTGAKGIISSFTGGCPYGSIVQQFERTYFKKIGIPTVALESTVHKEPPTEEQIMKVKTFIEMLA